MSHLSEWEEWFDVWEMKRLSVKMVIATWTQSDFFLFKQSKKILRKHLGHRENWAIVALNQGRPKKCQFDYMISLSFLFIIQWFKPNTGHESKIIKNGLDGKSYQPLGFIPNPSLTKL